MSDPLRILVIGAHPDDCDITAAGTTALWKQAGHEVKFVSVTNGESGHHEVAGAPLAATRREEAAAAGRVLGIEYEVMKFRDGYLEPSVENRLEIIRLIRRFQPDLVLTHRPNDYHPDHRYTSQLVCDAAYMVTVPPIASDVPSLRYNPVIAYLSDTFQRPYPFTPSVVVDIEPVLDQVVETLACHKSQFFEWLPFNKFFDEPVPARDEDRLPWLKRHYCRRIAPFADRYRELVTATYGGEHGHNVKYIEAFEPCEYGSPMTDEARRRLFPFLPN